MAWYIQNMGNGKLGRNIKNLRKQKGWTQMVFKMIDDLVAQRH